MLKNKKLHLILASVVTILLLYFLLVNVSYNDIYSVLVTIPLHYFLLGLLLYLFSYIVRSLRFWVLLNKSVGVLKLFTILSIHNLVNNLLPARIGEISYVYMIQRTKKATATKGVATLVVARIFDFISVALIFFMSILLIPDLPALFKDIISVVAVVSIFVILLLLVIIFLRGSTEKLFACLEHILKRPNSRILSYTSKKLKEIMVDLSIVKSKKLLFLVLVMSITVWCLNYLMCYLIVIGMGLKISIWVILLVFSVLVFISVVPISISGIGVVEGAWAVLLMSFGTNKELAISTGFGLHLVLIVYFLLMGAIGFSIHKFRSHYSI